MSGVISLAHPSAHSEALTQGDRLEILGSGQEVFKMFKTQSFVSFVSEYVKYGEDLDVPI